MNKTCASCGNELTDVRLLAVPDAVQCVDCVIENGDEPQLRGVMTWEHKTAPTLEVGTRLAARQTGKQSFGPHFRLSSKERAVETMPGVLSGGDKKKDDAVIPIDGLPSRCHSDRPRVSPSGLCLECALEWYNRRRKIKADPART